MFRRFMRVSVWVVCVSLFYTSFVSLNILYNSLYPHLCFFNSIDNLADINSLIFVKDDFRKFLVCNAHQISLHSTAGMPPRPVHAPKTKIRLLGRHWGKGYDPPSQQHQAKKKKKYGNSSSSSISSHKITKEMIQQVKEGTTNVMTLEMDLRFVSFPTMDKTTYYLEFFHHSPDDANGGGGGSSNSTGSTPASWTRNLSEDSPSKAPGGGGATNDAAVSYANNTTNKAAASSTARERMVSESPAKEEEPPTFDDVNDSEEWVGINDVLASGDIDHMITALLD